MRFPFLRVAALCLLGGLVLPPTRTSAQITVTDDGNGFTPAVINAVLGESVKFVDDGTGPYLIISDTGAWTSFRTPGGILLSQTGTFGFHDDAGNFGTMVVSPNMPPSLTITNPASNAVFSASATFTFAVDTYDPDSDGVSDVEFYVGTNLVDDVFFEPYTTTVTNLSAGTYILTAISYDNLGATATNQITVFVGNPGLSLSSPRLVNGAFVSDVAGLTVGKTNVILISTNLASGSNWVPWMTNVATASSLSFTNPVGSTRQFFRLLQLP